MFSPKVVFQQVTLKPEMNILDLGCGNHGFFTFPSAKFVGNSGRIFSVDVRLAALEELIQKAKMDGYCNILPVFANLEKKESLKHFVLDEQVDCAFCINTLSEMHQIGPLFEELQRVIKREGKVFVADWKLTDHAFNKMRQKWSAPVIISYAKHAGLIPLKRFELSPYHHGILFTRP